MDHTGGPSRRASLLSRPAWVTGASLAAVASAAFAWPYTVDDAFILARYALRIANGLGYTFNDGLPTDGVTGPLWLLPLTLGARLSLSPLTVSKLLGFACALGSALLVMRRCWQRAQGRVSGTIVAALLGSSSALWIWSIAGLETGAAALLTTVLLLARGPGASLRVGLAGGALLWLRPELAFVTAVALLALWAKEPGAGVRAIVWVLLLGVALLGSRYVLFGHFMPMTAHAKPPLLTNGLAYVWRSFAQPSALALLPGLVAAALTRRREERTLSIALLAHAGAVALAGGDWMVAARLFVPLIPAACLLAAFGFAWLLRRRLRFALVPLLLLVALRIHASAHELVRARASGQLREARLPELLSTIRTATGPIALVDIGALGYFSGKQLVDLGGLTEPVIAYSAGGHVSKRVPSAWLEQKAPALVVLHSAQRPRVDEHGFLRWFAGYPVERNVLAMPWLLARYRVTRVIEYDRDYFYVVLAPQPRNECSVKTERPCVR